MKKTLSLVLALVMVALMLPVAAFTTSAEDPYYSFTDFTKATPDTGLSGNIGTNLPTGWIATDSPETEYGHRSWPTTINYDHDGQVLTVFAGEHPLNASLALAAINLTTHQVNAKTIQINPNTTAQPSNMSKFMKVSVISILLFNQHVHL